MPAGTASPDEVEEDETEKVGPRDEPSESDEASSNDLNLPQAVITRLGQVADIYGYGLGPGTRLTYEQATNFAYAVAPTCDDWRAGTFTFQDSVDEDVLNSAPLEDARGMNRFLQSEFCPSYYDAGN